MIAIHDPVAVRAYGNLANRLLYDCIHNLKWATASLNRTANAILTMTKETPLMRVFWAQYRIHEARCRLNNEVRFIESEMFENLCDALDIDHVRAYAALKRKYADKCRKALELADRADRICAEYLKKS